MSTRDNLIIFDTTLRDGEQSPGAAMTHDEKLRIAKALEKLKVDVIEAGFPASSPGDFKSVHSIAANISDSIICGLARTSYDDIDQAAKALKPAKRGRIHTFIATSPIHMEKKLQMQPDEVVQQAINAVKRARKYTDDVEFSAEDAGRSEFDFLCRIIEQAIRAGATTINVPDTVGYNFPHQYGETIRRLIENIPNSDQAIFSTHCHNDLGMAVANSLAGVINGARQIECAINGIGERAGNAAIEEVIMAAKTRADIFPCDITQDTTQLVPCSKLVSAITGFPVQLNKAIVGANAFAHESGIHQDGVLKNRETYEIMTAQDVGWSTNRLTLGKLSGRSGFRARLQEMGIDIEDRVLFNAAFVRFKDLADKKPEIFDEDIQALISQTETSERDEHLKLVDLSVASKMGGTPSATVVLTVDGEQKTAIAEGAGAVDAVFQAINNIVQHDSNLQIYSVNNITDGTDSQAEVGVRIERAGRLIKGHGSDIDIVIASAKAYINALNQLFIDEERSHPQLVAAV